MRGVALRAGTHRLVFEYRPLSFRLGMALSVLGLAGLAGVGVWATGLLKTRRACYEGS